MIEWDPKANELFLDALERPSGAPREEFLRQACDGDSELTSRVTALLQASKQAGDFLSSAGVKLTGPALPRAAVERPGDMIGPYKLLQEIGEGGMGVVYMAEQREPIRRMVAVKIIKPGMDSRQVAARFEAERQALALMNHPHIAQVYDAGTTDAGRPYFVMELVKGLSITRYCDEQRLSPEERLRLFITVCQAVQHAHQKGVIHRDLKPSNVLLALYDGVPSAKVIDFGVAKATGPKLTDRTMFTEFGTVVGTLEYMSPEQAELNQLDVDTRSDVYSLGVLLYELVTGTTPLDAARLRSAPFDEMRRILREEQPPRPSTRLGSSAQLPALAAQRGLDPRKLTEHVRGDLDWIVMKALEKDRNRRYETADALARDLERYLAHEPVEARPPTAAYRIQMFARRYRGPVAAAALVAAVLVAGIAASTLQAFRATRAEAAALASAAEANTAAEAERRAREDEASQRAKAEERLKFLMFATGVATPELDEAKVTEMIDRSTQDLDDAYGEAPAAKAALLLSIARSYVNLERFEAAEASLRNCLELTDSPGVRQEARYYLAQCLLRLGDVDEGTSILQQLLLEKLNRFSGPEIEELRTLWPGLASAKSSADDRPGQDGLEFDGAHDFVVLPNLQFDGKPPWTVEAIVRARAVDQFHSRSSTNWTSIVSTTDGGGIGLETNQGRWSVGLYTASGFSDVWEENYVTAFAKGKPRLNEWIHLAGVWDGKELRLYEDGELQQTIPDVTKCSSLSEGPFMLGADPCDLDYETLAEGLFQGRFRAARISRAAEYTKSFPRNVDRLEVTPQTVALYDFTIDAGKYAIDRSGNGHHGVIVGARFAPAEK